jgi:lipoprotein-releasing system permease protein
MQRIESFIAWRYLISRNKIRFINIIGVISIVGITIGVAALLIALSVFNGFNGVVTDVLVGFDPHIRIEKRGSLSSEEIVSIDKILVQNHHIKSYAPFVSGKAMLVARSFNRVVFVKGVDEKRISEVSGLKERMVLGDLSLHDSGDVGDIIIGLALADRLGSVVGNEIAVISPYGFQSALSGISAPQAFKYRITGIYESNNRDYDANYAYISIASGQRLLNMTDQYNGVEIRLDDFNQSENVKEWLRNNLNDNLSISTWYDLHRNLYSVMKIERWSAYIFLCLIVVVAIFNMLGSLSMGVIEKRREIGVLKSMGMNSKNIIRIFMYEGLLIGVIGTIAGILLGLGVLFLQIKYQLFTLDTTIYIIPAIPVKILWTDFIAITLASMGLSFFAAYYPARRAAATLPAEAIRWE